MLLHIFYIATLFRSPIYALHGLAVRAIQSKFVLFVFELIGLVTLFYQPSHLYFLHRHTATHRSGLPEASPLKSMHLPLLKAWGRTCITHKGAQGTFMALAEFGSPSSTSSSRIPPRPSWSCLSSSLSRAFLSFRWYLGLKAYFPSRESIFGLLAKAWHWHGKGWDESHNPGSPCLRGHAH